MGNYNDHLMEQLADQGDGFYSYVDTFEEAERLFVDDLTPTLTVVAEDAKAQVALRPGRRRVDTACSATRTGRSTTSSSTTTPSTPASSAPGTR